MREKWIEYCIGGNIPGLNAQVAGAQYDLFASNESNREAFLALTNTMRTEWVNAKEQTRHAGGGAGGS